MESSPNQVELSESDEYEDLDDGKNSASEVVVPKIAEVSF